MTFSEFYCQTTGSNLNAGSDTSNTARLTYALGSWVAATGVFTVASGNPVSDGVVVGDFASVYATAATVTVYVARVTAVSSTTITVSLTVKAGTAPVDGTGNRELKIGGAWKGPNAASGFPFGFMFSTLNDTTNLIPRVNFKNNAAYAITAACTHNVADTNPVYWQGYTTTPGDGGRAQLSSPSTGATFVPLSFGSAVRRQWLEDFEIFRNGATGSSAGLAVTTPIMVVRRVYVWLVKGIGISFSSPGGLLTECDVYSCGSGAAGTPGIMVAQQSWLSRVISHQNAYHGFGVSSAGNLNPTFMNCISVDNSGDGFTILAVSGTGGCGICLVNCDSSNNFGSGLSLNASSGGVTLSLENCNFGANHVNGIKQIDALPHLVHMTNCGFVDNDSGDFSFNAAAIVYETGKVTYPDPRWPWEDAGGQKFLMEDQLGVNGGRGSFLVVNPGNDPIEGYQAIGSAPNKDRLFFAQRPDIRIRR